MGNCMARFWGRMVREMDWVVGNVFERGEQS